MQDTPQWILDFLPDALLEEGPRHLLWWQWIAVPILLFVVWAVSRILSRMTRAVLGRLVARTEVKWDDAVLARIGGPLTLVWSIVVAYALLPSLLLPDTADAFCRKVLQTGLFIAFFWSLIRTIDIAGQVIASSPWASDNPASKSLLPLGTRAAKVVVLAVAVVGTVSQLGYPVASLLAGLGIGGIAFALAAQKTVENVFGAFSIGLDRPFKEGDFVKIEDFYGTVQAIGLRSTRIRTLDRTVISIPNGRLADMRLETFAPRDRIRLLTTLGLVYDTTAAQMRNVLAGLEKVLRDHPKTWQDSVTVRFKELGASSLDIEIVVWFEVPTWAEFLEIRQEVLLQFMEVVEKAGSSFAFPTRTVHVAKPSAPFRA